jgi:hypothetical protein
MSTWKFFIVFFYTLLWLCVMKCFKVINIHIFFFKFKKKIPSNLRMCFHTQNSSFSLSLFLPCIILSSFLFIGFVYLWIIETIEINTLTYFGLVAHFEKFSFNVFFRLYVSATFFFKYEHIVFLILSNVRDLLCGCNMNLFIT